MSLESVRADRSTRAPDLEILEARTRTATVAPRIRVGVGGWTFAPWRSSFYPPGLPQAKELAFASERLSAIEINGTYYKSQKPQTFARWRDETPDDFVFSLKASRFATNRRVLAEAGESVTRFVHGGIAELGPKLGPIVWQFATSKRFDPVDFGAFLALLPPAVDGLPLQHVVDVRHESFRCREYIALVRQHGVATVFTESDDYPPIADTTGPVVYARVMRAQATLADGFDPWILDGIAAAARRWRDGGEPDGLPKVCDDPPPATPRSVFVLFISGAKEKAPAAAMALRRRLDVDFTASSRDRADRSGAGDD